MNNKTNLSLSGLLLIFSLWSCDRTLSEADILASANEIHNRVLTIDSHMDTPMWLDREEFDIGKDNSKNARGSKVDLARMEEGGLDACFLQFSLARVLDMRKEI